VCGGGSHGYVNDGDGYGERKGNLSLTDALFAAKAKGAQAAGRRRNEEDEGMIACKERG
jgi:hypothetical protein